MKKSKNVVPLQTKYQMETKVPKLIANRLRQLEVDFGFEEIEGEFYASDSHSEIHLHLKNLNSTYGRPAVNKVILSLYGKKMKRIA